MINPSSNYLPRIALISTSAAGFGDVGIGQKIKETLLSDFSVEQFVAASHDSNLDENDLVKQLKELHDPEVDELKAYFAAAFKEILAQQDAKCLKDEREAAIKQIFPEVEFEAVLQAKVQQYSAFVFFPALEGHAVPKEIQNTATPQVHLAEYGQRLQKSYITGKDVHYFGFSPLEIGILIPEALDKYYQAHKGESSLEKLQQLSELDLDIQLAVLDNPCTPENVKTFAENSKLYVGYAHDEAMILGFIEAICRIPLDQNLTICIFKPPVVDVEAKLHAILKEQQFRSLVVANYKTEVSSIAFDNEGSRQLRIVFLPNCPQPAMHHLLKVSEPETLVTGTQSFLEALALRKSFNYEMYYHLIEFIESFTFLLKEKAQYLEAYLRIQSQLEKALNIISNYLKQNLKKVLSDSQKSAARFYKSLMPQRKLLNFLHP